MKSNIIKLFNDAPAQLRAIADEMEKSADKGQECTVIWGGEVFQCIDERVPLDQAVLNTVFNCNFAVAKLMNAAVSEREEENY